MSIKNLLIASAICFATVPSISLGQSPSNLNDLEIAHVAYTASNIDIRNAHLALALSDNAEVRAFAETMIRDHTAVNDLALGLLEKLGAQAQDNGLSQSLNEQSAAFLAELSGLSGGTFDKRYAENELAYHMAVNDLVANAFIPNIENDEVRDLFKQALTIFTAHQEHSQLIVDELN